MAMVTTQARRPKRLLAPATKPGKPETEAKPATKKKNKPATEKKNKPATKKNNKSATKKMKPATKKKMKPATKKKMKPATKKPKGTVRTVDYSNVLKGG